MGKKYKNFLLAVFITYSAIIIYARTEVILDFRNLAVEGTIIALNELPNKGAPRYVSDYTIQKADGSTYHYKAFDDSDLPRSMPIGTYIKKEKGKLTYIRDKQTVDNIGRLLIGYIPMAILLCWIWLIFAIITKKQKKK